MSLRSFWKLHGLGNDFIFFDSMKDPFEISTQDVIALCDRHTGIGADGIIVVKPSARPECDGYMHYINADGTLAQMCGNGVRCFAKFLVDHGYVNPDSGFLIVDTLAGPKSISFSVDENKKLISATVDMGNPILDPALIPTTLCANAANSEGIEYVKESEIDSPWGSFAFTCVSMGNPHAVCFLDEDTMQRLPADCFTNMSACIDTTETATDYKRSLSNLDVDSIGAFFEAHELFPEKTNVEFAVVYDRNTIEMRVFERGCGETQACGTGACATQVTAYLLGKTDLESDLYLRGGTLHIALDHGTVFMTGPACERFSGTVDIETKPPATIKTS